MWSNLQKLRFIPQYSFGPLSLSCSRRKNPCWVQYMWVTVFRVVTSITQPFIKLVHLALPHSLLVKGFPHVFSYSYFFQETETARSVLTDFAVPAKLTKIGHFIDSSTDTILTSPSRKKLLFSILPEWISILLHGSPLVDLFSRKDGTWIAVKATTTHYFCEQRRTTIS